MSPTTFQREEGFCGGIEMISNFKFCDRYRSMSCAIVRKNSIVTLVPMHSTKQARRHWWVTFVMWRASQPPKLPTTLFITYPSKWPVYGCVPKP